VNNYAISINKPSFVLKGEDKMECLECRGSGFWWKQIANLEVGARFTELEKIICSKCKGTGIIEMVKECEKYVSIF
jgi:DnaJ-class molecular chaperone